MSGIEHADAYLTIPSDYALGLGGPRWSHRCDAVEWPDGSALALVAELQPVLEGVFTRSPVPPFPYVLNLLHLMKSGVLSKFDRLRDAFHRARGSAGMSRNVGLLIAELCSDIPPSPETVTVDGILSALRVRQVHGERHRPELAPEPPLPRFEFEKHIAARLEKLDDVTLDHWFRFGCAPPPGNELAKVVESLPVRVARLLNRARQRPRLVGAAALTPVVDAALTIPPRRRTPDPLPQGGYADVTTRGDPERLLPGQFALDPDEFVRRFAENELLYFEREEPHAAVKPERLIVLDQGVRTWGSVRLALAAATLALFQKDTKRIGRVRLITSSSSEILDIANADLDELADVLEASDLTTHPGDCLRTALTDASDEPRDVILLTHPRNLHEQAVGIAANSRRKSDRLFALSVDETGQSEFVEWSESGIVSLRTFRIDLSLGEAAQVSEKTKAEHQPASLWNGDIEPMGFPFRPGLVSEPTLLGFDADSEWLVVVGRDGILHGMQTDGSPPEVLPRAFTNGVVLKNIEAVLGVTGGVVVCGRMTRPGGKDSDVHAAAHYDRTTRKVKLHTFGAAYGEQYWTTFHDLHCIVMRSSGTTSATVSCAIDLSTHGKYPGTGDMEIVSRARVAWDRKEWECSPPHTLPVVTSADFPRISQHLLAAHGNTMEVWNGSFGWAPFTPMREGKPLLAGHNIEAAQIAGAALVIQTHRTSERHLMLFRGPAGNGMGEVSHHRNEPFTLSPDGSLLARRRWHREIVIADTSAPNMPKTVTAQAALHNGLGVRLAVGPFRLSLRVGGFEHVFSVSDNRLSHALTRGVTRTDRSEWEPTTPLPVDYDLSRFPRQGRVGAGPLRAVADRLGQVLLLTTSGEVVASFVVRRDRAAAWIPGQVFWGDTTLIGAPPTPNADITIGHAIQSAGG